MELTLPYLLITSAKGVPGSTLIFSCNPNSTHPPDVERLWIFAESKVIDFLKFVILGELESEALIPTTDIVIGEVGVPVLPNLNDILPMLSVEGVNGIPINDVLDVLIAFSEPLFSWSIFTALEPNPCNIEYAPS